MFATPMGFALGILKKPNTPKKLGLNVEFDLEPEVFFIQNTDFPAGKG